jgi:hypothetical protein
VTEDTNRPGRQTEAAAESISGHRDSSLSLPTQCPQYCDRHDLQCIRPPHRAGWHDCPETPYGHHFYAREVA